MGKPAQPRRIGERAGWLYPLYSSPLLPSRPKRAQWRDLRFNDPLLEMFFAKVPREKYFLTSSQQLGQILCRILNPQPCHVTPRCFVHVVVQPARRRRVAQSLFPNIRDAIPFRVLAPAPRFPGDVDAKRVRGAQAWPFPNQHYSQRRVQCLADRVSNCNPALLHDANRR
jgi:hypothetical protein